MDSRCRYMLSGGCFFFLGKFDGWQHIWFQGLSCGLPHGPSLSLLFHMHVRIWSGEINTVCMIVLPECQWHPVLTLYWYNCSLPLPHPQYLLGSGTRWEWSGSALIQIVLKLLYGVAGSHWKKWWRLYWFPQMRVFVFFFCFLDLWHWGDVVSSTSVWQAVAHCTVAFVSIVFRPSSEKTSEWPLQCHVNEWNVGSP